jgi:hypothetical protein
LDEGRIRSGGAESPLGQLRALPQLFTPIPIDRIAAAAKARRGYLASVQFWTPPPTTTASCPFNFEQLHWDNQGILLSGLVHSVGECKPNVI